MSTRPVVLVTGGARRLGRAIALELARAGWNLAVHYRHSEADAVATCEEARETGAIAVAMQGDLEDELTCRQLIPRTVAALGQVDAVVNNASLFEHDDLSTFSHASMERHWRANTFPALALSHSLLEHLQNRGADAKGCVVNLLDQKLWNLNPDHLSYTLSKAALETATRMVARVLAPQVRIVGVAPGVSLEAGPMTGAAFEAAHAMTPLGHASTPDDIARAVRFVLESPAITGTSLIVDGGQHLTGQQRDVMFLTAGMS